MYKAIKPLANTKPPKDVREKQVLLGLVDLYLRTGMPVGSNTLREGGFEHLSAATIRNYFAQLEATGFLKQQHASGGRMPTQRAYKLYAQTHFQQIPPLVEEELQQLQASLLCETREVATYLQQASETLSDLAGCAVFLSSPRFDQDFVVDVKFLAVDQSRCICVLITDFGLIHTELLLTGKKLSHFTLKRLEAYFHWKLTGFDPPTLDPQEEKLAMRLYNEVVLRHIVTYTHFTQEDIYKTGFSKLLHYPDFNDASALAQSLSLFENTPALRNLIGACCKAKTLSCWIGDDLQPFLPSFGSFSVLAVPYSIHQTVAGAIGLLGPVRIPYKRLFALLTVASQCLSQSLTKSVYKHKISVRKPSPHRVDFKSEQANRLLLEDQSR